MSKSLNTHLSITDGGPYSLNNVTFFKDNIQLKKPGLDVLSSYYKYKDYRYFEFKPLGGIDWKEAFENQVSPYSFPFTELNKLAQEHVENFWSNYNIKIDFSIDHKIENTFVKGSYILKAHYAFKIYDEETKTYTKKLFRIRGFREDPEIEHKNPIKYLLDCFLEDKFNDLEIPNNGIYETKRLLRLKTWIRDNLTKIKNKYVYIKGKENVKPGDAYIIISEFRLNNAYLFINTYEVFKKRNQRSFRKQKNSEKKMPLFEKTNQTNGQSRTNL